MANELVVGENDAVDSLLVAGETQMYTLTIEQDPGRERVRNIFFPLPHPTGKGEKMPMACQVYQWGDAEKKEKKLWKPGIVLFQRSAEAIKLVIFPSRTAVFLFFFRC